MDCAVALAGAPTAAEQRVDIMRGTTLSIAIEDSLLRTTVERLTFQLARPPIAC